MNRAARRRLARKKNNNNVDITSNDDTMGVFGNIPLDIKQKLALEPCEELNGKTLADLILQTWLLTEVDKVDDDEFEIRMDEWIKS
tara:strand:- start:547 stop:804 length:258 start_codon:yes stop_codon:yes gene_type:complete